MWNFGSARGFRVFQLPRCRGGGRALSQIPDDLAIHAPAAAPPSALAEEDRDTQQKLIDERMPLTAPGIHPADIPSV